jgi:hypothetical protein
MLPPFLGLRQRWEVEDLDRISGINAEEKGANKQEGIWEKDPHQWGVFKQVILIIFITNYLKLCNNIQEESYKSM